MELPPAVRLGFRADDGVHALSGLTMGTGWSAKFVAPEGYDQKYVRSAIQDVLDGVSAEMSTWIADSAISKYNQAAAGTWHSLPADFHTVLEYSLCLASETGGAFDPTVGALVDLWGFGPSGAPEHAPATDVVSSAQAGWRSVSLENGRGIRQPGGVRLDLSGVAKGFAVDRVSERLASLGFRNHLVEIGGELCGRGMKSDGSPWWVAVEQPQNGPAPEIVIALHELSVATSGDAQRTVERDGVRWSHTIDPRSRRPVSDEVASVTVVHRSCMFADALATAITVLGPAEGMAFAVERGIAVRMVTRGPDVCREHMTPALDEMLS